MAYGLITSYGRQHRYEALAGILVGYSRIRRLNELELRCLPILIVIRLSMSVMIGAYSLSKDPDNEYLKLHSVPARQAIQFMCAIDHHTHSHFFQLIQDRLSSTISLETDSEIYDKSIYSTIINQVYSV